MVPDRLLKLSALFLTLHCYFILGDILPDGAVPLPPRVIHVHTLTLLVFSLLHALYLLGLARTSALFALGAVISWAFEHVGVATGFVYGPYFYTDQLGLKLGHVPLLIPLAWFMMLYPSYVITSLFTEGRPVAAGGSLLRLIWFSLLSAMVMTGWDLPMDPNMVARGNWVWTQGGAFFGVPLRNFAGWLATTFCVYLAYLLVEQRLKPAPERPARAAVAAMPVVAYGAFVFLYVFTAEPAALRVIAVFSMGLPVLFALGRLRASQSDRAIG
ncbi:MAG TPA: carotenoid biosynthesis protein [Myxococcaceae bacterium]|jgi:putative membrane protein